MRLKRVSFVMVVVLFFITGFLYGFITIPGDTGQDDARWQTSGDVKNKPNTSINDDFNFLNWKFQIRGNTRDSWIYGENDSLVMKSVVVDGSDAVCYAYSNTVFNPLSGNWKLSARIKANSQGVSPDGPWGLTFGFIDTSRQNYVSCRTGNGDGTQLNLLTSKGDDRLYGSFDATKWHIYRFEFSQGVLTFKVDDTTYDAIDLNSKGFPGADYRIWLSSIGRGRGSSIENIVTVDWVKLKKSCAPSQDIALIDLFHGRDGSSIVQQYGFSPKINSNVLTSQVLEGVKVYFLYLPNTATASFQASEISILKSFVAEGGNILVVGGEDFITPQRANPLLSVYGMALGSDTMMSEVMNVFVSHPITKNLSTITYIGADPITVNAPAQPLGYFRNGNLIGIAIHELIGQGKVVVFADGPAGGDADTLWRNTWNYFKEKN
jgi:hypothetical protein